MNYLPLSQQISLFADLRDLSATPQVVSDIFDSYRDANFLPTTFKQFRSPMEPPESRPRMISVDQRWCINFAAQRLDIVRGFQDPNEKFLEPNDLLSKIEEYANPFFTKFKKSSFRLTLMKELFLYDIDVDAFKQKFLNLPGLYAEKQLAEWSWRAAAPDSMTIANIDENINIITAIDFGEVTIAQNSETTIKKGFNINIDINTNQHNQTQRFNLENLIEFIQKATVICGDIEANVLGIQQ